MEGEEDVVGLRFDDRLPRSDQLGSNDQSEDAPDQERDENTEQVHHPDTFVVKRECPGRNALGPGEVVVDGPRSTDGWIACDVACSGCVDCGHESYPNVPVETGSEVN